MFQYRQQQHFRKTCATHGLLTIPSMLRILLFGCAPLSSCPPARARPGDRNVCPPSLPPSSCSPCEYGSCIGTQLLGRAVLFRPPLPRKAWVRKLLLTRVVQGHTWHLTYNYIQADFVLSAQMSSTTSAAITESERAALSAPMVAAPPRPSRAPLRPPGSSTTNSCFGASRAPGWTRSGERSALLASRVIRMPFAAIRFWLLVLVLAFACAGHLAKCRRRRRRSEAHGVNQTGQRAPRRSRGSTMTRMGHRRGGALRNDVSTPHVFWATLLVIMGRVHAQSLWSVSSRGSACELSPDGMCVSDGDDFMATTRGARCVRRRQSW
jgi:hypothetical protein